MHDFSNTDMNEPKWGTCSGDVWNTQSPCSISGCSQKELIVRYQDPQRRKRDQCGWYFWQTNTHKWGGKVIPQSPPHHATVSRDITWAAKVGLGVRREGSTLTWGRRSYGKCCSEGAGAAFQPPSPFSTFILCEMLQSGISFQVIHWEWGRGWTFKWSKNRPWMENCWSQIMGIWELIIVSFPVSHMLKRSLS